jgi:hypothetical protein
MEVDMREIVFESQLLLDGHLYCPKEYATPSAKFKVIVSLPDEYATDSEIELASVIDISDEFLSEKELNYYIGRHSNVLEKTNSQRNHQKYPV